MNPLLEVKELHMRYPIFKGVFRKMTGAVHALNGVNLTVNEGETLAIVGESGCGKSTLAQAIIRLILPTEGHILFLGRDITKFNSSEMLPLRREMQMVFQDPYSSLNPKKSIGQILSEPLLVHGLAASNEEAYERALSTLEEVGLSKESALRFPHQFSGGQQQRIAIGRALILRPKLILLDEAVSSLDLSVQAQILNLLADLKAKYRLSYLFITHDLRVVESFADRVIVLYMGKVMETAGVEELFKNPNHPYTQALLSAIPRENPWEERKHIPLKGEVPSSLSPPSGCPFRTRCPYAQPICAEPPPKKSRGAHDWFCILDDNKK